MVAQHLLSRHLGIKCRSALDLGTGMAISLAGVTFPVGKKRNVFVLIFIHVINDE